MKLAMKRLMNRSELDGGRHTRCYHLVPKRPVFQRRKLSFYLKTLDLMLKMSRDPDVLVESLRKINRRLCGLRMRKQLVGNRTWPYLEGGKGETVVLLHGFGADKDRFGSFLPMLGRGYHKVVPDIPGFGEQRQLWSANYDVDAQVHRLERFIDAVGLQRFHLMGISLGGYMAAYYAARHANRVQSLCLMDSAGFSSPVRGDALQLFETTRHNIFLPESGAQMQLMMDYLLYHRVKLPETLNRYWLDQTLGLRSWRQKLFDDLMAGGINLMDDLACRIKTPTLVVWGAQDRIFHVSTVDHILALIGSCQSYILQGCGHIPIIEHPVLSVRLYRDFLVTLRNGMGRG